MIQENKEIFPFIEDIEPFFYKHSLTYVDVGAFKGEVFQAIAQSRIKVREAHLIEPHPKNFAALEEKVANTDHIPHIRCHNLAISSAQDILQLSDEGTMSRILGYKSDENSPSSSSLSLPSFEVDAITLDAFAQWCDLRYISLLKVDVEGHEIQVFEGATELLKKQAIDMVYVEAGFDPDTLQQTYYRKIEDLLSAYNYHLFKIYEQKHEWMNDDPRLRRVNLAFMSDVFAARNPYRLSRELFALQNEIESFKEQIQLRDRSLSELQENLQAREQSISELKEQFEAQKELTREYFTLLTQADQEQAELQQQIQDKDKSISEIQNQLEEQRQLTQKYFLALSQAETEQEQLRSQIADLQYQNQQYQSWMQKLQTSTKDLLKSGSWTLGNIWARISGFFTGRSPYTDSAKRVQGLFSSLENNAWQNPNISKQRNHNHVNLINSMHQLHKNFQSVMRSRRWRLGNTLVNFIALLLRRPRHPASVQRMQDIFNKFQDLQRSTSPEKLSPKQIRQLQAWMTQLEKDHQALLKSRRWKLGNFLCSPAKILFWREKRPKALDRMQEIFESYRSGQI